MELLGKRSECTTILQSEQGMEIAQDLLLLRRLDIYLSNLIT